jgi:hypothetical protein
MSADEGNTEGRLLTGLSGGIQPEHQQSHLLVPEDLAYRR